MPGPWHFDADAELYERARPPYPPALWSRLGELGVLQPGSRALDLGAGTGQATGPLLAAGLSVTAIEPGVRLAARLLDHFPTVDLQIAAAEDAVLGDDSIDVAVAATSIHWMDLAVVLPLVHRALVPRGRFLIWRNAFGDPSVPTTPFRERVADIVAARDAPPRDGLPELETERWATALSADGLFTVDLIEHFRWSIRLDERQVQELFSTFSDWSAGEADAAGRAVRELGGSVVEHYVTPLIAMTATG